MARSLRYHPLFDSDVLGAGQWYDDRHPELGSDFVRRVRKAVEQLIESPESGSSIDHGLRYSPVERFPYVVFYSLTDFEVLILGVLHTSRDSQKWLSHRK